VISWKIQVLLFGSAWAFVLPFIFKVLAAENIPFGDLLGEFLLGVWSLVFLGRGDGVILVGTAGASLDVILESLF
jgi:hypothetical protein